MEHTFNFNIRLDLSAETIGNIVSAIPNLMRAMGYEPAPHFQHSTVVSPAPVVSPAATLAPAPAAPASEPGTSADSPSAPADLKRGRGRPRSKAPTPVEMPHPELPMEAPASPPAPPASPPVIIPGFDDPAPEAEPAALATDDEVRKLKDALATDDEVRKLKDAVVEVFFKTANEAGYHALRKSVTALGLPGDKDGSGLLTFKNLPRVTYERFAADISRLKAALR
jgi:hypothetical protein